ncbi:MAG: tetratricopeptide repeat protein [Bacteroidales bacterium]|nr:tetratricopeptide repeat protein [Bacteroidales bacterium]
MALFLNDIIIHRNIGEFYFETKFYKDAIEVFNKIDTIPENIELWQKIAYSWQKLGDYQKALEYYLKADLTDIRKTWNIKKIALCYKRLGQYDKALHYYLEAEKVEPEDLQVQANLAHTYFEMNDFESALKIYFKVEYLAPDNHKIQRPIGWCSFMLGKYDTAKKYFQKLIEIEPNEHDLLNIGHVEWCSGNKQNAIEKYSQSIRKASNSFDWFSNEFMADS